MRDNMRLNSILIVATLVLLCLPFFDMVYLYPAATRLIGDRLIEDTHSLGRYFLKQLDEGNIDLSQDAFERFAESFALQEIGIGDLSGELRLSSNTDFAQYKWEGAEPVLLSGEPFARYLVVPDDSGARYVLELRLLWPVAGVEDRVLVLRRDVTAIRTDLDGLVSRSAIILFAIAATVIALVVLTIRMARDATGQLRYSEQQLVDSRVQLKQQHAELEQLFTRVEQAKREWQLALDCISDMVLVVDEQGKIRRCNEAVIRFLSRSYIHVLGKNWQRVILPENTPVVSLNQQNAQVYHGERSTWLTLQLYPYQSSEHEHLTVIKIVPQLQPEE